MTFPLGSLRSEAGGAPPARKGARGTAATAPEPTTRWPRRVVLSLAAVGWVLCVLALATHHPGDAAFTTSGTGAPVRNAIGRAGAYLSDVALFLFGWSAWWLPLVALRAWLGALARALRRADGAAPPAAPWTSARWVWAGTAMLMAASCSLEWTRLYQWEPALPGHAGGVVGATLGPLSMTWLGFVGSGVTWIAALVLGSALALRFSWLRSADALGAWLESLRERREERRERAEDRRLGEAAQREREQVVEIEREHIAEHEPIVIAPAVVSVPKSERVAKERQQPLFTELADTKLPQVDLLDAAPPRQETVTPESLEMTSRLIEKKLKDFGVEVRVVAAAPGPVITR
jgi:S-DNA-T family DNA segregation ATPase FtsK/SpoIIIE